MYIYTQYYSIYHILQVQYMMYQYNCIAYMNRNVVNMPGINLYELIKYDKIL